MIDVHLIKVGLIKKMSMINLSTYVGWFELMIFFCRHVSLTLLCMSKIEPVLCESFVVT